MELSHSSKVIVAFILVLISSNYAGAAIIYESATMGPTGQTSGYIVDSYDFIGSRFYVSQPTQVTAIGGHLVTYTSGGIFGAIVRLYSSTDLPNGIPFDSLDVAAYKVFIPSYTSSDFRTSLSVTLQPGYYALVFGSGLYDADGSALMPIGGQSYIGSPTYFAWDNYEWFEAVPVQERFVVEGTVITNYCTASGGCVEYISGVQVGSINNTGTSCSGGYADYTALSTNMEIGKSYTITVTNGFPSSLDRCGIWIDWNQDKDFDDAGEAITVNGTPGGGPYTATITPPDGAVLGNTRMRVRIVYNTTSTACGASSYGETEDYTINVMPAPAYCSASASCDEYISGVQVGSINNTGTSCSGGYASYTSQITTMEIGKSYPITVTEGGSYPEDKCGIWVDWNQDLDFDEPGEAITVSGSPSVFNATITPPAGATLGNTRMRVQILWNATPTPCGISAYGETEDYTINVTNPAPTTLNISGYIKTSQGVIIKGVNVSASTGQSTVTDALGKYSLTLPNPFNGSITPSQTDWTFNPPITFYAAIGDLTDKNYTGTYNVSYGGGSGTSVSPYLIYTAAQLNAIGAKALDWGKCFKVMANIDLSAYDGKAGRPSFNRIGVFSDLPFTGIFDGNNCTISNFKFDSNAGNDGVGMFGCMDSGTSQIKNVKLTNVDVNSISVYGTGAIVGWMTNGTISGCSVQNGTVSGGNEVGGLVGMCWDGIISGCSAGINVTGIDEVGGILGETGITVTMTNCRASCNVAGQQECGGMIGKIGADTGSLIKSSSSGSVTATVELAGGLVGSNSGTVNQCYSTTAVAAVSGFVVGEIGGLAGRNLGNISSSYSMGSVSGFYPTGGLIGFNWKTPSTTGSVTNCYSTGTSDGCGLIGQNTDGVITSSFWDINASGTIYSAGGTGKTITQMKTKSTFTDAGWDFVGETANGYENIWRLCSEGLEYPKLAWQYLPGDIVCPDGVGFEDVAELSDQWLFEEIPADLAPPGGDGIVNFADFVVFADQWKITADTNDLFVFAEQWLKTGQSVCSADISHDNHVDFADFALMAGNWLKGF